MRTNEEMLRSAPGYHEGTVIASATGAELVQLASAGLVGAHAGLTRKGSILAQRLKSAEEDRLFPL